MPDRYQWAVPVARQSRDFARSAHRFAQSRRVLAVVQGSSGVLSCAYLIVAASQRCLDFIACSSFMCGCLFANPSFFGQLFAHDFGGDRAELKNNRENWKIAYECEIAQSFSKKMFINNMLKWVLRF